MTHTMDEGAKSSPEHFKGSRIWHFGLQSPTARLKLGAPRDTDSVPHAGLGRSR